MMIRPKFSRSHQAGNIFFALFGAIAMVGILGGAVMTFMKGPLSTSVKLTKANTAESQMAIGAQVAVMATASQADSGDCDSDGYVEPIAWRAATTEPIPVNGGLVPLTLGMSKKDPWGTEYGYCVWNHGAVTSGSGCDANMLAGTASKIYPVVAIVSAGPDKTFTTTCRTFAAADANSDGDLLDAGDAPLVSKAAESDDDIIFTYTYEEATGASGGLWNLKSGDPTTAAISKDIEVTGNATITGRAQFSGGVNLPDSTLVTCDGTTTGVLARNTTGDGLKICDGSGWQDISGSGGGGIGSDILQLEDESVNLDANCTPANIGLVRYVTTGTGDRDHSVSSDTVTNTFGGTVPTLIQKTTVREADSTASSSQSFATLPSAGDTIIVAGTCYAYPSVCSATVTDNQGNTYTRVAQSSYNYQNSAIFVASNIPAPSGTFTVTYTQTGSNRSHTWGAMEFSGVASITAADTSGTTGVADWLTSGGMLTVTATGPVSYENELAVTIHGIQVGGSCDNANFSSQVGWDLQYADNTASPNFPPMAIATRVFNPIGGTASHTWSWNETTCNNLNSHTQVLATLRANGVGGATRTVDISSDRDVSSSSYAEICDGAYWVTIGDSFLRNLSDSSDNYTSTSSASTSQSKYSMFLGSGSGDFVTSSATNNSALGYHAQYLLTSGTDNSALGEEALQQNQTGSFNSAFGYQSLLVNTTSRNTAFGSQSMLATTSGGYNTAFGYQALLSNITQHQHVAVGVGASKYYNAPYGVPDSGNVSVGYNANKGSLTVSNNTGYGITAVGANALAENSGDGTDEYGSLNTAMGAHSLQNNVYGTRLSACGYASLKNYEGLNSLFDYYDVACGSGSAESLVVASYYNIPNTVVGSGAFSSPNYNTGSVAVGYRALYNMAAGADDSVALGGHVAIGWRALYGDANQVEQTEGNGGSVSIGAEASYGGGLVDGVVAIGAQANYEGNLTGYARAFGYAAAYSSVDTTTHAIGAEAARNGNGSGWDKIAIGYQAMGGDASDEASNSGGSNLAVGYQALKNVTFGNYNSVAGYRAGYNITVGGSNIAIGPDAMYGVSSGNSNIAIGRTASNHGPLYSLNGDENIAVGDDALALLSGTCTGNVAIGRSAMHGSAGCGNSNVAIGDQALKSITTGAGNTAVGGYAGSGQNTGGASGTAVTTESSNTFIGYDTQLSAAGYTNSAAIGSGAQITGSNRIVLGNTSISAIYAQVTSITAISDRRHKKDVEDLNLGLPFINSLQPVSYRFNNGDETLRYGLIAQDVEKSLPDDLKPLVSKDEGLALVTRDDNEEGTYHLNYFELLAPLVKAVQQISDKFDEFVADMEEKFNETRAQLARLMDVYSVEEAAAKSQDEKLDRLDVELKALEDANLAAVK